MNKEGLQNLANAVVRQAALDYRAAYKRHLRHPHDAETRREIESLERFFHSRYFCIFTTLSPDYILNRIRKEQESEYKKDHRLGE